MAVGNIARCVAHDVGPKAVLDSQVLHDRVQPTPKRMDAVELYASAVARRMNFGQNQLLKDNR